MAGAWLVHGVCMACAWHVRRAYVTVEQLAGERGKAVAAPMRRDERCETRALRPTRVICHARHGTLVSVGEYSVLTVKYGNQ